MRRKQTSAPLVVEVLTCHTMHPNEIAHRPNTLPYDHLKPKIQEQQSKLRKRLSPRQRQEDQEIAGFLLSLKHSSRSVSPEPSLSSSSVENHTPPLYRTASAFTSFGQHFPPGPVMPNTSYMAHNQRQHERHDDLSHHHHYAHYPHHPSAPPPYSYDPHHHHPPPHVFHPTTTAHHHPNNRREQYYDHPPPVEINIEKLIGESKLVSLKDRDLVPDSLFVAMAQMKQCQLSQSDRVGSYKTREIGFTGMCCMHCGGQPGFGRFFPNSVRSLAQTTTSHTILKHVGSKCRYCPPHIRAAVVELQRQQVAKEGTAAARPRYGSRKIFFQRIWMRLHGGGEDEDDIPEVDSGADVVLAQQEQADVKQQPQSDLNEARTSGETSTSPTAIVPDPVAKVDSPPLPTSEHTVEENETDSDDGRKRKAETSSSQFDQKRSKSDEAPFSVAEV